jgi:voltage-gated potassium channel Kch
MDSPEPGAAILAGFGRMGSIVGRLLMANNIKTTVLDMNPELVENSRKLGLKAYYGDALRADLLHAAGAPQAKILIIAIKNPEKATDIAQMARKHFPHLEILVRATERVGAYALLNAGFSHVYRETFGTALQMGEDALRLLGLRAHKAHRASLAFRRHNEAAMRELAKHWGGKNYWTLLRSKIEEAEGLFKDGTLKEQVEAAWDNEALREAAAKGELKR